MLQKKNTFLHLRKCSSLQRSRLSIYITADAVRDQKCKSHFILPFSYSPASAHIGHCCSCCILYFFTAPKDTEDVTKCWNTENVVEKLVNETHCKHHLK